MEANFLATFLDEAEELIEAWAESVSELEQGFDQTAMDELFRAAHSLKGSGKSVGLDRFGELVHCAEDLLDLVKKSPDLWNDRYYKLFDELRIFLSDWRESLLDDSDFLPTGFYRILKSVQMFHERSDTVQENSADAGFGLFDEEPDGKEETLSPTTVINRTDIPVLNETEIKASDQKAPRTDVPQQQPGARTIRVGLDEIEQANQCLGELTVLVESLKKHAKNSPDPFLRSVAHDLHRSVADGRGVIQGFAVAGVEVLLQRLEKTASDTAKTLGKEVQIDTHGHEIEVEKGILQKLTEPLIHIVRNAVDHGIESKGQRITDGKTQPASLRIAAESNGLEVVISCSDNGRGIDPRKIEGLAIEKGLIAADHSLTDQQVTELVFAPGFSSAKNVSEISGRGVGMDVVKRSIENLGGKVKIRSIVGKGSKFEVRVPSNVKVLNCLIVNDSEQIFALPLELISEIFLLDSYYDLQQERSHFIPRCNKNVPVLPLCDFFGYPSVKHNEFAALVEAEHGFYAFSFERIIQQQPIFLRPIEGRLRERREFLGSAVLANGDPALVLNISNMMERLEHAG